MLCAAFENELKYKGGQLLSTSGFEVMVKRNPLILFFVGAVVAVMLFAGIRTARNNRANGSANGQLMGAGGSRLRAAARSTAAASSFRACAARLFF